MIRGASLRESVDATRSARRLSAKLQADDAATWQCLTCTTIIEAGKYCGPCGSYWKDCEEGLWDDDN